MMEAWCAVETAANIKHRLRKGRDACIFLDSWGRVLMPLPLGIGAAAAHSQLTEMPSTIIQSLYQCRLLMPPSWLDVSGIAPVASVNAPLPKPNSI